MTSVTQTCRDINELRSNARQACQLLFQECYKAGIVDIFITETYRSQARQNYLYAQGRTRPGKEVTWTLNSNHTPRLAWDIAVAPPKDLYDKKTLNKVGAIATKLGIEWGGTWGGKNYDAPHFQVSSNWKIPKGYIIGDIYVPTKSNERVKLKESKPVNHKPIENKPKVDDDIMKFTSPTVKEAVRTKLEEMISSGHIDKSWLEKFDKETMTSGDFEGLKLVYESRKGK